ncbi:MAG TPA: ABC transporter substrate-binding protein, partial [Jiangellales bacterium]|nr:ABC transporter substrate-binding protein [Jiangellales bacterium]
MRIPRLTQLAAAGAAVVLMTSGCLSEGTGGGGGSGGGGDKEVEIVFGFGGDQSKGFQKAVQDWAGSNNVKVKFTEASQSFDTLIRTRAAGNNLPDMALFPQPGLMLDIAKQGKIKELSAVVDVEKLKSTLVEGELSAGTSPDGKVYAAPMSMNVKSLVWYPKKAFEAKGYQAPKTLDDLNQLAQKIKADGVAPWCIGIESGPATGWPATDWIEDLVLHTAGTETYDKWTKHEIPFNDPAIKSAGQEFEKLAFTEGNVFGGRKGIVSSAFSTAANPMFQNPPKCMLHRMGNFITQKGFFPDAIRTKLDTEVGVFQFPGKTPEDKQVLGGGDLAAAFNDEDATKKVMEFITSDKFNGGTKEASYISPHKTFDMSQYPDETTRNVAKLAYEASEFRFDGSDLMPGAVGAGSFWKGMVAWISGQKNLDTVL